MWLAAWKSPPRGQGDGRFISAIALSYFAVVLFISRVINSFGTWTATDINLRHTDEEYGQWQLAIENSLSFGTLSDETGAVCSRT